MICTEKLPVPPIRGGAIQTYISGALPFLKQHHQITVLGITDPSLPEKETVDGIHYVRVPGTIFEIYMEGVIRYVQSNQFDLIHIFNRPRLVIPVRQVAPNSKITLSMHNDMFQPEKISPEEGMAVIREVSLISTVSDYIGRQIESLFPQAQGKVRTIYSGVDSDRFLPGNHPRMRSTRQALRREHDLENKTVILFAGRLSNNKGVDRLIRALPELTTKYKDLALVIVGSNWFSQNDVTDYVAYVRALAGRIPIPVVTTGFVAQSEIQNWFAAADIFVCTSIWQEPLARVHYEAMAAGLPIITTARGGNPEVIIPGENGYVVEQPEDPSQFAEKLSLLLSNPTRMKKMGERGRELALSLYQWDRVASEIHSLWNEANLAPAPAANLNYVVETSMKPKESVTNSIEQTPIPVTKKTQRKRSLPSKPVETVSAIKQPKKKREKSIPSQVQSTKNTNLSSRERKKEKFKAMLFEMMRQTHQETMNRLQKG